MKLKASELRSIIAEVAKKKKKKPVEEQDKKPVAKGKKKQKRQIKESPHDDLREQLMSDPNLEGPVHEIIETLLDYTGNDEGEDVMTAEGMMHSIYEALTSIVEDMGDVESDSGPPPLPR